MSQYLIPPDTFPEVAGRDETNLDAGESSVDEEEWEDEEDLTSTLQQTSSGGSTRTTPLRRRKAANKFHASRKLASPKTFDQSPLTREAAVNETLKGAIFTGRYAFDVFDRAIHLLRIPLSFLLFLWLLVFIIGRFSNTLRTVAAPLCIFPGTSKWSVCRPLDINASAMTTNRKSQWADYPKLMDIQNQSLKKLMVNSVGGSALSLEIKKTEMATADLVTLVRYSNLKSKDSLLLFLTRFIHDAKRAGRGLQKLGSKVGGAVDNIMTMNDYALHSIESARASSKSLASLLPWNPNRQKLNEVITKTFEDTMDAFSNNIARLIIEAEISLHDLNKLEEQLNSLHDIITREESSLTFEQSELLAQLWTILGGNKKDVRNFENNLALLKGLGTYRRQARRHVVVALEILRGMSDDMEDLRQRVAAPNLIGSSVPVEVHMKSIKMGLERLIEGRFKAMKLDEDAMKRVFHPESDNDV
ncbi:hypothetical protein GALMADRAFT_91615 [Galerina marginata CBS 339.88]|uniref:Uncharacterized protein n=1 Tax=Galerina marginata (strain CBS 339.88) TaxID=685588 RepID=A0A067TCJ8_GALM3|nr:hypothetical protein GALMADRAFT_91615 [Galerina marginata CBS 339.88]